MPEQAKPEVEMSAGHSSDRALLEAAAKAAGLKYTKPHPDYSGKFGLVLEDVAGRYIADWSPLTDDGDALRLLVMLSRKDMVIMQLGRSGASVEFDSSPMFGQILGKDLNECARRAIVAAAAASLQGDKQ